MEEKTASLLRAPRYGGHAGRIGEREECDYDQRR